jgi:hypothetical protein
MLETHLCEIGLNKNEAKVYLELLKIGSQPASVVSKRIGFNRSSLYSVFESLMSKGLVSFIDKEKVRLFTANDPSSLVAFIDKECSRYEYFKNQALSLIPKIRGICGCVTSEKPKFQVFDGFDSLKINFEKISRDSSSLTVYFPSESETHLFSLFLSILKNFKLKLKFILPSKFVPHVKALRIPCETSFVDLNSLDFGINHLIALFDEKLCFLSFEKNYESLLLIEEKGYHGVLKALINSNYLNSLKKV